ncbi:MAG: FeoB-associated Cys-rich membrane protein [Oscillospiraceae bacterium]|nr:FeoB-associated Cys-rich membrane protein [Oscillospiraceae bacterium]
MATFIIAIILIALITGVIFKLVKDKKNGKSSCGCNCGCCPNSSLCHTHKNK